MTLWEIQETKEFWPFGEQNSVNVNWEWVGFGRQKRHSHCSGSPVSAMPLFKHDVKTGIVPIKVGIVRSGE